jgi:hypothetical protein
MCFSRVLNVWCSVPVVFRTYVASVLSECCKSRSGAAHVAIGPTYRCASRGKRRDGTWRDDERRKRRGMAAGARGVLACPCRARAVPSITGETR